MHDWVIIPVVAIVCAAIVKLVRLRSHAVERRPGWDQAGRSDAELWALADRLQARVETLERLLDAAQPEWRNKP